MGKRGAAVVHVPRIGLKKTFGWGGGNGLVKDICLAVPGTAFFEQDFYVRPTNFDEGNQWLSRTLWLAPFKLGSLGAHYDGPVLIKRTNVAGTDLFAQQDLLIDVVPRGMVQAGVRLEDHHSEDESRFSPHLMFRAVF